MSQIYPQNPFLKYMAMLDQYDYLFKIVIIGDSGVGKTNLLLRLAKNQFFGDTKPTIGVEFDAKTFTFDGTKVKAQIWDTAGQERYRAITSAYYRGTKGALLVYDVTSQQSFEDCMAIWLMELNNNSNKQDIVLALIGNKSDVPEKEREVSIEQGRQMAEKNGMIFFETSAMNGENVEEAFKKLVFDIYIKNKMIEKGKLRKGFDENIFEGKAIKKIKGKKKGGCC